MKEATATIVVAKTICQKFRDFFSSSSALIIYHLLDSILSQGGKDYRILEKFF
jgi:hypothetical protein